jgi:Ca2+-binding EF-hand superfamily protein
MERKREPKKSETLEVRLPHEVKVALMSKAQGEGRSASEVIRNSIDAYLAERPKEKPNMLITAWKPVALAGTAAVAVLWTALSPAPLVAGPDFKAAFQNLDENQDNAITLDEFIERDKDMMFVQRADKPAPPGSARTFMLPLSGPVRSPLPGAAPPPKELMQSEFTKEDRDGNGSVTFAEFQAYHQGMLHEGFASIDTNADGFVQPAEYQAAIAAAPGGGDEARFENLDKDKDGRISEAEFFG